MTVEELACDGETIFITFETINGEMVLTFSKRLNEDQYQRPSEPMAGISSMQIRPNEEMTDLIFAVGSTPHRGRHWSGFLAILK